MIKKNKIFKISLFLALILLPFGAAKAADLESGQSVYVAKDQIIAGNFYAAGANITVDGTISGDLIAAGQTINVNGRVDGDVIAAGQNITVNGAIGGNVRIAGNSLTINGSVARNVNAFGANIVLGDKSKIGWDALIMGASAEVRGEIDGSLTAQASRALIAGQINKNADLKIAGKLSGLTIAPEAKIAGNLTYTSPVAAKISNPASIGGETTRQTPPAPASRFLLWLWSRLWAIFAALVVGLILVFLVKKVTTKVLDGLEDRPQKALLPGLIIMLILPPIALLLVFTLIGIPLALIIAAWWLIATYVARILAAIFLGRFLFKKVFKKNDVPLFWCLVLGVVIAWLLFALPFIGWLFALVAIWLGLGGLWNYASQQLKRL